MDFIEKGTDEEEYEPVQFFKYSFVMNIAQTIQVW